MLRSAKSDRLLARKSCGFNWGSNPSTGNRDESDVCLLVSLLDFDGMKGTEREGAGSIAFVCLMPHPPIVVPGVGEGRERGAESTVNAMRAVAERLVRAQAQTLVVISPHSPRRSGCFGIWRTGRLTGSLGRFGCDSARVDLPPDVEFADRLAVAARAQNLEVWEIEDEELDHGAVVPLYYLTEAGWKGPTVVAGLNPPGEDGVVALGQAISSTAKACGRRTALLASGDMSHRLNPDSPAGFHPEAHRFDEEFVSLLKDGSYKEAGRIDEGLQSIAGEDVVDSSRVAFAALEYDSQGSEVVSYEGPFGVGYCVAVLYESCVEGKVGGDRSNSGDGISEGVESEIDWILPRLARSAVEREVSAGGDSIDTEPSPFLLQKKGVFVTIRNREGHLRGCRGFISSDSSLIETTRKSARSAAFSDHRFSPVEVDELPNLNFEVSVLEPMEEVLRVEELDPSLLGVVVKAQDGREALMLPGIQELDTVEKQLSAVRDKAGILPAEAVRIFKFRISKFTEDSV